MHRRPHSPVTLFLLTTAVSLFVLSGSACVRLPHGASAPVSQIAPSPTSNNPAGEARVNINTASAKELEKLPGIGRALSARIISYREQYGRFRRAEHLIMVRGIGDKRFRGLRPFVTVQ